MDNVHYIVHRKVPKTATGFSSLMVRLTNGISSETDSSLLTLLVCTLVTFFKMVCSLMTLFERAILTFCTFDSDDLLGIPIAIRLDFESPK